MNLTQQFRDITRSVTYGPGVFSKLPKSARWSLAGMFIIALYFMPYWPDVPVLGWIIDTPGTSFQNVLTDQIMVFVLMALGLNVVVGFAGLLDLGYVGFYAVGAYTTAILTSQHASWPWLAALPVSVIAAMVAGVILGTPTLRLRGDYLAIVTLGFGEIIRITANNSDWLGGPRGINNIKHPPDIGPLKFTVLNAKPYWYLGLTVILLVLFVLHRLERSRVGRAWSAVREDEDAAELMGVDTFKFKLWAFAIGAAVGGLAGSLYATKVAFINPDGFLLQLSILFLAAVVLGGTGNMYGAIVGGFLVAWVPERFRNFDTRRYFVFGCILVLVMVFRPQGIIPRRGSAAGPAPETEEDELEEDDGVLLKVESVTMQFGGVTALDNVSLEIRKGEILGLIGPNGAGKTTCFNVITGVYTPTIGSVTFEGETLAGQKRFQITKRGIARTFQNIRLFPDMSALENVMVGADAHTLSSVVGSILRTPRQRAEETRARKHAGKLLKMVGIYPYRNVAAKNLPYGHQRRLEIARALATNPKLLCLDEPAAGFNPAEKQELNELILKIRSQGYTVLLIEHDMSVVMNVSDRVAVLDFGRKIAEGVPEEVRNNPAVIAAYLGVDDDAS
jgi:branched-chain amino acid transport system permease protein